MQVAILGPLEVTQGAQPVEISGARLRALLARLALDPGRAVSAETLAASLWEDDEPADVANALQSLVSRLRRVLPADVLESRPGAYRLLVDRDDVDAFAFEAQARTGRSLLRDGSFAEAGDTLRAALDLWHGPALADVRSAPFATAQAARLEELRIGAVEDRIEADLASGGAADAVAELESLTSTYPLRERLAVQLVTALAGTGRPAEALAAFERTRAVLADELGTDPSPELLALHTAVLRGEVPSLPTASHAGEAPSARRRSNLPAQLTSFIGREPELERIGDLLADHRLVTLVGPGGAGKTRLACESAARAVAEEPVWLVELAPVSDADDIAQAALGALDLRETNVLDNRRPSTSQDALERLVSAFRSGPALVVLDNCEHLIDGAARFADHLLTQCPELRIVATSREPLGITGEMLCPLPPLGQPAPDASPAEAVGFPAVELFVARARSVVPDFAIDDANVAAVVEVCRRLDGQPLAIELAAARLRTMSPTVLASRLDDRFRLLTGGSRTADARHRTLRAVVEWSWDLLDDAERRLVEVVAVFPAGATADAVHSVAAASGVVTATTPERTEDLLDELASKSLLRVGTAVDGSPRFRMLETIREFGVEKLAEHGDVTTVRRAHARYYRDLVERAEPFLRTRDQLPRIAMLEQERDNILGALRFAADEDDADTAVRIGAGLSWFWWSRGGHAEAAMWLGIAADVPGDAPVEARAVMTVVYALSSWQSGTVPTDDPRIRQMLSTMPDIGPDGAHPIVSIIGPIAAMLRDDNDEAFRLVDEGLEHAEPWSRGTLLMLRGRFAENDGDVAVQRASFEAALAIFEEIGERWGLATMQAALGEVLEVEGDLEGAAAAFRRAIELADEIHAIDDRSQMLSRIGLLEVRRGDLDAAEALATEAHELATSTGSPQELMFSSAVLSTVRLRRGDLAGARALLDAAGTRYGGVPQLQSMHRVAIAAVDIAAGDLVAARNQLVDAHGFAIAEHDMPIVAFVAVQSAELAVAEGDPAAAAHLVAAADVLRGTPDPTEPTVRLVRERLDAVLGADAAEELLASAHVEGRESALAVLAAFVARDGAGAQTRLR